MLTYSARDEKGHLVKCSSDLVIKEELIRSLQTRGLLVISIEEKKEAPVSVKRQKRRHKKARLDDLIIFARQMAVLLESGVTILRGFTVMTQQVESEVLLKACRKIEEDLKAGTSLKDAISKHPRVFSQIWVDLIETGEATGQLSFVLQKLAGYFEDVRALRKKVVSALIYPAVLIVVSTVAIFIFIYKVIPIFAAMYKGFGKIPFLTAMVIGFSEWVERYMFKVLILLAISGFFFRKFIKTENGRKWLDNFVLKIPLAGDLLLSIAIERFATTLSMMLKGGISIVHALEIAIKATANRTLETALEKVKASVIEGRTISAPLAATGVFPPLVVHMISVGEESGRLSYLLDEVSKFYGEDVSTKVDRLVSLFEPGILIIMGIIIAIIVVAMYLPIFSLTTMIQ